MAVPTSRGSGSCFPAKRAPALTASPPPHLQYGSQNRHKAGDVLACQGAVGAPNGANDAVDCAANSGVLAAGVIPAAAAASHANSAKDLIHNACHRGTHISHHASNAAATWLALPSNAAGASADLGDDGGDGAAEVQLPPAADGCIKGLAELRHQAAQLGDAALDVWVGQQGGKDVVQHTAQRLIALNSRHQVLQTA